MKALIWFALLVFSICSYIRSRIHVEHGYGSRQWRRFLRKSLRLTESETASFDAAIADHEQQAISVRASTGSCRETRRALAAIQSSRQATIMLLLGADRYARLQWFEQTVIDAQRDHLTSRRLTIAPDPVLAHPAMRTLAR